MSINCDFFASFFFRCKNRQKERFTKIYSTSGLICSMKSKCKYRMAQIRTGIHGMLMSLTGMCRFAVRQTAIEYSWNNNQRRANILTSES